jgi:hypothetical protein
MMRVNCNGSSVACATQSAPFTDRVRVTLFATWCSEGAESDTKVQRGHITKQGSRLVRWAAIEAVVRYHGGEAFREQFVVIAARCGRNKGQRGHCPQSSHARLLRPWRRRSPLSPRPQGGVKLGHGWARAR